MFRLAEQALCVHHLTPVSRNANTYDGTGKDTAGYDAAMAIVSAGTLGTNATLDVKLQESNDDATYTDVTDKDGNLAKIVQMTQAGGDSDKSALIDIRLGGRKNAKKYLRARAMLATAASVFGVALILYNAQQTPVTNTPAAVIQ